MTIRDYTALLEDVKICQGNLETADRDLKQIQAKVVDLGAQYKRLIEQKNASLESVKESIISEEVAKMQAPIGEKIRQIQLDKQSRTARYNSERDEILGTEYERRYADSYAVVKRCNEVINLCSSGAREIVSQVVEQYSNLDVSDVTVSDELLSRLADRVAAIAEEGEIQLHTPFINKVFGKMFLPRKDRAKDRKSSLSLLWLLAKSAVAIGMFSIVPILMVTPYSFGIVRSIRDQSKNAVALSDNLLPLAYLYKLTALRREYLDELCRSEKESDVSKLDRAFNSEVEKLDAKLERLALEESQVHSKVLESITDEDINARVNQQYAGKVQDVSKMRDQAKAQVATLMQKRQDLDAKLRNLRIQQASARTALENELIDLNHVGTDKALLRSFFLGFDESGRIISLDYEGDTSLIMYSGADSSVVSPFVNMMIIQYFTTMLVNTIRIDIVDLENGGIEYNVFKMDKLDNVVNIIADTSEESILLEDLHADMRSRSERIATCADNIDDFNRIMLERDSLTMDYRIVIFQAFSESLTQNIKFLQLCRQGAKNGIIMFLFTNISSIPRIDPTAKTSGDQKDVKQWRDLIYAIPKQFFNFNSESGEVSALGLQFKTASLAELDKFMSGVGK